jgi:fatty-acyl-CoA synthase
MVALLLHDGARFDGKSFYAFVSERLPRYACPAFVRVQLEADLTGTFKLRKVDLQKQGFDPSLVGEPLFARDDASKAYVPLTPEVHAAIRGGKWSL